MTLFNIQIGYIIERCKRISILFSIIAPILRLILKTATALIGDIIFLLCTISIPLAFLFFISRILFFFF